MRTCKVINKKNAKLIGENFHIAENFFTRLKGLMFERDIVNYSGLLITRCNSIHTCFMKFDIDVVFLDKNYKVIKVIRNFRPWRMTPMYLKASQVLELKGGTLVSDVEVGDEFEVVCLS